MNDNNHIVECANNLFLVKGSIFDPLLCLDGIAVIIPAGLTGFRCVAEEYFQELHDQIGIYYPNRNQHIYERDEACKMIINSLERIYAKNCRRIGINSVKNGDGWDSDIWTLFCVMEWMYVRNIQKDEIKLFLIDERTGFLGARYEKADSLFHQVFGIHFSEISNRPYDMKQ